MYSLDICNLPGEIWKDIEGFEGIYQVSNKGRVKSLDRYKLKKGYKNPVFYPSQILRPDYSGGKKEYLQNYRITLGLGYMKDKERGASKHFSINRLVAEAFIPNPDNYDIVLHKDGDIANNCVENLEWADIKTHRDHERYILGRELGTKKTKMQCIETGKVYNSLKEIANEYKMKSYGSLVALSKGYYVSGRFWKPNPDMIWRGYHWKVID